MTTSSQGEVDYEWGKLAELAEEEREPQMLARYSELATLSEEERRRRLFSMAQAEYALPDEKLRSFTRSRLRVWLRLDAAGTQVVASAHESIMGQMPGPAAMRGVAIVQTLAREFPLADAERLQALLPNVFGRRPMGAAQAVATVATRPPSPPVRKAWWAFWRHA